MTSGAAIAPSELAGYSTESLMEHIRRQVIPEAIDASCRSQIAEIVGPLERAVCHLPVAPWNPWRALVDFPGWLVVREVELPGKHWGLSIPRRIGGGMIFLCKRLGPEGQRTTLAHELVHIERGIRHFDDVEDHSAEEEAVITETVRRLIPVENLAVAVEALGMPGGDDAALKAMARYLGVVVPDVRDRFRTLTDGERAALAAAAGAVRAGRPRPETRVRLHETPSLPLSV